MLHGHDLQYVRHLILLFLERNSSSFARTLGTPTCGSAADFLVDVGKFTLLGVTPLSQDQTCISGLPCGFGGLVGIGLSSGDRL